jgi:hypothetical protein
MAIAGYADRFARSVRMAVGSLFGLLKRRRPQAVVEGALSGYFELRPGRIVGWATDGFGSAAAGMRIEVLRHGRVLAGCDAVRQPELKRFAFSLPVAGLFTGAELVTEDVTVVARDSRGASGRVLLDGAAQLELIRDHLGAPAVTVLDLDFSGDGNAKPYLGAGWYGAERDFTWTADVDSFVSFDTPREPGTYALRLTAGTLIQRPELTRQNLGIFLNETQIARFVYTDWQVQFQESKFDHAAFGAAPRATLRLHHPEAVRPSELLGQPDPRRLAFKCKRLSIARLLGDD